MLKDLALVLRFLGVLMILPIILFLIPATAQFVAGANDYPLVKQATRITRPVTSTIRQHIPLKVMGYDAAPWMAIALALVVRWGCRSSGDRLYNLAERLAYERSRKRSRADLPAGVTVLRPVETKPEPPKDMSKKDRDALLKEFVEAKKRLEEAQKDIAVVSDAVDAGLQALKAKTEASAEKTARKKDEGSAKPGEGSARGA